MDRKRCGKRKNCSLRAISPFPPLQKHVRKVVGSFGKKSCVSTGVRKPGNTCASPDRHMTLAIKLALDPNTTNKPNSPFPTVFSKDVHYRHVTTRACLGKG